MTEQQDKQQLANELFGLADANRQERERANATRGPDRQGRSRRRTTLVSLVLAVPILIAVLVVNFAPGLLTSIFETQPSAQVARQEAQKTLDALVVEIEAFRKDYKELPETLAEIGMPSRGQWTYAAIGKVHYQVNGSLYGQGVNFDSATDRQKAR